MNRWKSGPHISAPGPIAPPVAVSVSKLPVLAEAANGALVNSPPSAESPGSNWYVGARCYDNRTVKIRDFLMTPVVI